MDQKNSLKKAERLHLRKVIGDLFEHGKSLKEPSFVLLYKDTDLPTPFPAQVAFSVSKRLYKKAVDRNRIKRLMKESYRVSKHEVYEALNASDKQMALMFIYTGKRMPDHDYVSRKISRLLKRFKNEVINT